MPVAVDELERLLQSDPHAQELSSPYISSIWEMKKADIQEDYSKEYAQRTQSWAKILAALSDKSFTTRSVKLGEPSGGKFTYPIQKRRTQENTEALR
ncbi:hypothetical protein N7481_009807 [Penicillium waksmanii]|uniref:uncharacterized protein n=1 Tax=Penicillium waksmanii TaxID=69791 RepID=UPI00254822CC|nr:uncharacterized protein N7481_009807 [Penicillium waksmanii]KAJ5976100.1 hypothetical protein N7481_009807 [Penicillium waksmanii]